MVSTIDRMVQIVSGGVFQSEELLTQSTATAAQSVSLGAHSTHLGMGTATGIGVNVYSLGTATTVPEGLEKFILATATGEAKFATTDFATATGALTWNADGDWGLVRKLNGTWWVLTSNSLSAATE